MNGKKGVWKFIIVARGWLTYAKLGSMQSEFHLYDVAKPSLIG